MSERLESDVDLVVAGKADAIAMVEGEMNEISEADMVEALEFGFDAVKTIVKGIEEFVQAAHADMGEPTAKPFETVAADDALVEMVYGKIKTRSTRTCARTSTRRRRSTAASARSETALSRARSPRAKAPRRGPLEV